MATGKITNNDEIVDKLDIKKNETDEKNEIQNGAAASPMDSSKETVSIFSFIQLNTNSLAAIGLIGTMIALMPTFVEKLNDEVWLGTFSNFQIACLFLSIIAGFILIFLIFFSILDKYYQNKFDLPFTILLIIFIIFMGSFLLFIYSAIRQYLYVQGILLVIYVILGVLLILNLKKETKRSQRFSLGIILFFGVLFFINATLIIFDSQVVTIPDANNTKIQADVDYYSPLIPQTYGIGFSPISGKKISFNNYYVNWTTDYGYFFIIDSNNYRIRYLGNTTENNGQVVYWTYDKEKIGLIKPTVYVSMIVKNQAKEILTSSIARINWSDTDMAHVLT